MTDKRSQASVGYESGFYARAVDVEVIWHGQQFFVGERWFKLIGFVDG